MTSTWRKELQNAAVGTVQNVGHQCEQDVQGALSMPWMHTAEAGAKFNSFLTSALDTGEWSTWHPGHFTSSEEHLLKRRLGGSTAGLDILEKRKICCLHWDLNPWPSRLYHIHHTNYATTETECTREYNKQCNKIQWNPLELTAVSGSKQPEFQSLHHQADVS